MAATRPDHAYLLALGSNAPDGAAMLARATRWLAAAGLDILASAPAITTPPMGPARRRFANGALHVRGRISPPQLLRLVKQAERALGRRRGRRWGDRPIDIDIILWSGGRWQSRTLTIPHRDWRSRAFVLLPASQIADDWRDPLGPARVRHLADRISRTRPTGAAAL